MYSVKSIEKNKVIVYTNGILIFFNAKNLMEAL